MCLAVPGRVVSVQGNQARVDFGGISREVYLDLVPEVGVDDWVLVHAGFAIQQMDANEAAETLALFAELEAASATDAESVEAGLQP